jgi:hypothetical protein
MRPHLPDLVDEERREHDQAEQNQSRSPDVSQHEGHCGVRNDGLGLLTRWQFERSSGSRRFSLPLPDHVPDPLQLGILLFIRVVDALVPLLRGGLEQPAIPRIEVG